jgi:hypothetical protein
MRVNKKEMIASKIGTFIFSKLQTKIRINKTKKLQTVKNKIADKSIKAMLFPGKCLVLLRRSRLLSDNSVTSDKKKKKLKSANKKNSITLPPPLIPDPKTAPINAIGIIICINTEKLPRGITKFSLFMFKLESDLKKNLNKIRA